MKWYWYVIIGLVVLALIYIYIIEPIVRKKKVYQLLLDVQFERFKIEEAKRKQWNYVLHAQNKNIYLKVISVPANSQVSINSKETWMLNYGGSKNNKGKVYPKKAYITEVENFLKNDLEDEAGLKVVMLYKECESIVRYLNESELDTIDIHKSPYGYKVTSYKTFKEDIKVILK